MPNKVPDKYNIHETRRIPVPDKYNIHETKRITFIHERPYL